MWKRIALLLLTTTIAYSIDYSVHFIGLDDVEALSTVKSASFLTTLKKQPPASLNALRSRAESDIPDMVKALHSRGYYEATVNVRIEEEGDEALIFVMIQSGPVYLVQDVNIEVVSEGKPLLCAVLTPEALGIRLGRPAMTTEILDGEQKALALLGECGYPLAILEKHEMVADYATKQFFIKMKIDAGPMSKFGATSVTGQSSTKQKLFENKISWKEDDVYEAQVFVRLTREPEVAETYIPAGNFATEAEAWSAAEERAKRAFRDDEF